MPPSACLTPPRARKYPKTMITHGIRRKDNYAWLKAKNWPSVLRNPDALARHIRHYLEQENAYQEQVMADTRKLQKQLMAEMKGRIQPHDSSVPEKDGPYAYGVFFEEESEHPHYFRTARHGGRKKVYLDGNREAQGKAFFHLGSVNHAPDHNKFLWSYDDKGSEFYTIHVRAFRNLKDLPDILHDTAGDAVWDAASEGFFYRKMDKHNRPNRVYYHRLGTDQAEDRLVFKGDDPGLFTNICGSLLHDFVFIEAHDYETSEIWLVSATQPLAKPRRIKKRKRGVQYSIVAGGDTFYILTNHEGAKDFKIMAAPASAPRPDNWQDFIPHCRGRLILHHAVYQNHLVWLEYKNTQPRIVVMNRKTGQSRVIAYDKEAYCLSLLSGREYFTDTIRYSYSCMDMPEQIFEYTLQTGKKQRLKVMDIPSGHNSSDYITRRVMAPAADGETIPISLLYHKNTDLDGSAPCLIVGYGAYGVTLPASFDSNILSLVNRGFVYAIAHIRGGMDKGYSWYENGKHTHKVNTFTDFIAAARYLVQSKYTSHDRMIAHGESAGGMVMGAIANMQPQDFCGIVALVPFVDVLTTMLDHTLWLTPTEWPEWGNPAKSVADYKLLASYSPYDNVKKQPYPHMLVTGALTDPRVTYWEPAKWVAKLRAMKTDNKLLVLRTDMETGHEGPSGRFVQLEEVAFIYAFALKITNRI